MLDVHAPHETIHSWKSFSIHIAAIVVGLLIAVALEQMVEFLHHRHQRELDLTRFGGRVVLPNLLGLFAVDDAPSVIGLSMRRLI